MTKLLYDKLFWPKAIIATSSVFIVFGLVLAGIVSATSGIVFEAENAQLSSGVELMNDSSASGGQAITFSSTEPESEKRYIGVYYSGGDETPSLQHFGQYPEISSTYYQANQIHLIEAREKARIDRNTVPNVTITTRSTDHISGLADNNPASIAWLDDYIAKVKLISDYADTKNLPVFAGLESEWEVKVNQGWFTGRNADPAVYGKALSVFNQRLRQNAPKATSLYWVGGSDHTKIGNVMNAMTTTPQVIGVDPYVTGNSTNNATQSWKRYLDKFRASNGAISTQFNRLKGIAPNGDIKFAITEHGFQTADWVVDGVIKTDTNHTDEQTAAYYTNLQQHMIDSDVIFSIFFNSDRDRPYKITPGGVHPVPQAVINFAQNMSN